MIRLAKNLLQSLKDLFAHPPKEDGPVTNVQLAVSEDLATRAGNGLPCGSTESSDLSSGNLSSGNLSSGNLSSGVLRSTDSPSCSYGWLSPQFIEDPYPYYEYLRARGSVHYLEQEGFWLVLNYADVLAGLKDTAIFSSQPAIGMDPVLLGAEAEAHARARRKLAGLFSSRELEALCHLVEEKVETYLKAAASKHSFDLVADVAVPLSEKIIADLIGLSEHEREELTGRIGPDRYQLTYVGAVESYFCEYLQTSSHSQCPDGSWLQRLRSDTSADRFTVEEIVSLMKLLWIAGTTTTSMLVAHSTSICLRNPAFRQQLLADDRLIPHFIDETLRYASPEQTVWRVTTGDTSIDGVRVEKGAQVRFSIAAANRDPRKFPNPTTFDLHRSPNDHLAFGGGIHFCIGANLARLEARIVLSTLLTKFPSLKVLQTIDRYVPSDHFRALARLTMIAG